MGFPFYGYGWNVSNDAQQGQFVPGTPVDQGESYAYITGLMSTFQELRAEPGKTPFLFNGSQFWTYDDPTSIREKVRYANAHELRGAMAWELSQDLPDGELLKTIARTLFSDNREKH
jgi:chitinase